MGDASNDEETKEETNNVSTEKVSAIDESLQGNNIGKEAVEEEDKPARGRGRNSPTNNVDKADVKVPRGRKAKSLHAFVEVKEPKDISEEDMRPARGRRRKTDTVNNSKEGLTVEAK